MKFVAYRIDAASQKDEDGNYIVGKYDWRLVGQREDTLNWKEVERAPETEAGFKILENKARTLAINEETIFSGGYGI